MIKICTICARGGSKGVKNKNVRELLGLPLIAHTILQAQKSNLFEAIAVSSDSEKILKVAEQYGVKYLVSRPEKMASDSAAKVPAIKHCVMEIEKTMGMKADVIVDLDATSPLRTIEDIQAAVQLLLDKNVSNIITGAPARRSPYFNLVEQKESGFVGLVKQPSRPIVRRQDAPACYDMNASIYVWKRDVLIDSPAIFYNDTLIYEMPPERSIDIDSELDFEFVEFMARKQENIYKG